MTVFVHVVPFICNKQAGPFGMGIAYLSSFPVFGYLLSKKKSCFGGTLNTINIRVEIMLVPGTFLSISMIEFSVGSSCEKNSLVRVWVNTLSGRAAIPNGILSRRTLQPFTLFLGFVTRTWNEGPSGG
eukprot:TRINITY_DN4199_c0_g2_i7.p1 TRINITY_DN4199_c0_g2~~TRINITY_DN4199_c0_g2_i7.p1  ORF type:complete len:128 (+),score=7.33 TRINITY_DN4199_c0_g2_i7:799-1182(+)